MSIQTFWVGDKQYIVSETTSEEKAILKEKYPDLHAQYFPEVSVEPNEVNVSTEIKPAKKVKATDETNN